jgi:hypothetical protein
LSNRPLWATPAARIEITIDGGRYLARMLAFWAVCPSCQTDLSPVNARRVACLECCLVHNMHRSSVLYRSATITRIREAAERLERLHPALFSGDHEIDLDIGPPERKAA